MSSAGHVGDRVGDHVPDPTNGALPPGTRVTVPGPLGPWRLTGAVLAVAVTTGPQLARATSSGHGLDQALGRALVVAVITWVLLGVIDRFLTETTVIGKEAPDDRPSATGVGPDAGPDPGVG